MATHFAILAAYRAGKEGQTACPSSPEKVRLRPVQASARADWLKQRLTGDQAREDWVRVVAAALDELLDRPWTELLPRQELRAAIEAHRSPERGQAIGRGIAAVLRSSVEDRRADDAPVERFFDDASKETLVRLVRRPGLVPEDWVRHAFSQRAAEELVADTLAKSLRDFSTVIPRTLANVLPGLLGKFAKLGSSIVDRVVDEIEARLEPEIRRYVEAGSRRALDRAADFAVRHLDTEMNLEGRVSLLRFALASSGRELVLPISEDVLSDVDALAEQLGRFWSTSPAVADEIEATLDRWYAPAGGESVREAVRRGTGEPLDLPFEAWARASWPAVRSALQTPAIGAWLEQLAAEMDAVE